MIRNFNFISKSNLVLFYHFLQKCFDLFFCFFSDEQICEGHGFNQKQCESIPGTCCHWDDGDCWSDVGNGKCKGKVV